MPNRHSLNIFHALKKTNPIAAKAYLEHAHVREKINSELVHTGYVPKTYEEIDGENKRGEQTVVPEKQEEAGISGVSQENGESVAKS